MDVFLFAVFKKKNTPFLHLQSQRGNLDDGLWKTNVLAYIKLNFRGH